MAVYVAHSQGFYKIGYTLGDPLKRIAELQVGNPSPVELIGTIPGNAFDERKFHDLFQDKRVRGEWFALTAEDVQGILSGAFGAVPSFSGRGKSRRRRWPGVMADGKDLWLSPQEEAFLVKKMREIREEFDAPD